MDNSADFMIVVVAAAALCIGAATFVAIGIQFRRGRWLRLIAGNTFASDDELGSPEQKALGRRMGVVMFVGGLALVVQACFHASDALGPSGPAMRSSSRCESRTRASSPPSPGSSGGPIGRDERGQGPRPPSRCRFGRRLHLRLKMPSRRRVYCA